MNDKAKDWEGLFDTRLWEKGEEKRMKKDQVCEEFDRV